MITEAAARAYACRYVHRLTQNGYTPEDARQETCMGQGGPREPGYVIRKGKITVPGLRDGYSFRYADLAKELRPLVQMELGL